MTWVTLLICLIGGFGLLIFVLAAADATSLTDFPTGRPDDDDFDDDFSPD